ncbi:MAG TPA: hypothetical protein ENI81_05900 [Phycisphaerales bacterium]|nr:hypothetical protein [Phycisphaerales bacterium]
MKLFVPREVDAAETRVSLLPADAGKLVRLGAEVEVERGLGDSIHIPDRAYEKAGAEVSGDRAASLAEADVVLRISAPGDQDLLNLAEGCVHISYVDPFKNLELIRKFTDGRVSGISLEMIPRTTIAQKMDVLSSQANLAVETGGNVEASELGKEIDRNGVTIIGRPELERMVPVPASQMLSSNLYNLVEHFWHNESKSFRLDRDDEIMQGCLVTHEGQIVNEAVRAAVACAPNTET